MANGYRMVNDKLVQLTDAEEKARQEEEVKLAKEQEDQDTARQTQITKKASAITKLKTLGLDDDEISALIGAS